VAACIAVIPSLHIDKHFNAMQDFLGSYRGIHSIFWVLFVALSSSCGTDLDQVQQAEGYRPIYATKEEASVITVSAARAMEQTGKIYARGQWVFVNELNKGIHIINNTDTRNPQKVAFLSIPGNVDMAVKGNMLYADNYTDLVVINIADPHNPVVANRIANALPLGNQAYPPFTDTYFECVDQQKGVVIGWERTTLANPKCRR
jgi:hypothetical protein